MSSISHRGLLSGYIGAYRITNVVGKGGFGVVYRAYQPFLEREVAIKVIRTNIAENERLEQQFMAEARTIARLRHPNIVTVYEFGSVEQQPASLAYMVMEYLPGTTLENLLYQTTLSVEQIVEITEQLAAALNYAHRNNVVHRDLKPANIIFSEQNQPVIVDFGLAMLMEVSASTERNNDDILASSTKGTPSYMAPEQALGLQGGPASDQYALALIVYEMLAKCVPFRGDTVREVLSAKLEGTFRPLSKVAPHYPTAVDAVLRRALSVDPSVRYANALDFSRALSEALLPDRQVNRTVAISDPLQAARLRSARQTVGGFMWGLMFLTFVIIAFCLSLFIRGYINADNAFIWDGIIASTSVHDGWRDVIALWPASPAARAGIQLGDQIKTDIYLDTTQQTGDFTINGRPRSSYPVEWNPQIGDTVERTILRNGSSVTVHYALERSPFNLIILIVQLPAAVLAFFCASRLLSRWQAEPGVQIFTVILMVTSFTLVASGVTNEIVNIDSVAVFLLLPLLLHLILMFPEPMLYFEQNPRHIWLIYLPFPIALGEFLSGLSGFDRFNVTIYLGYAVVLVVAIWFKWIRHNLKRYPPLRLLIFVWLIACLSVLLGESLAALDDYATIKAVWGGNGLNLLAVDYGVIVLGSMLSVLLGTLGLHRVQMMLGRTVPEQSIDPTDLPDIVHTIIFDDDASTTSSHQQRFKASPSSMRVPNTAKHSGKPHEPSLN